MKGMTNDEIIVFNVIGKKYKQTSVSTEDRETQTLRSTDNAGYSVNLITSIIRLPLSWDLFSTSETDDRFYLSSNSTLSGAVSNIPLFWCSEL